MATSLALLAVPPASARAMMWEMDSGEPTDGQLIVRTAGGDRHAFEELHARYRRAVLRLALRRIGDRGRAEDATQDAFVAVWRSARTYDPTRGNGATWLYAVARNAITNRLRRTPEPVAEAAEGPGVPRRPGAEGPPRAHAPSRGALRGVPVQLSEVGPALRLIVEGWRAAALSGDADLFYLVTAPWNFSPAFIARHEALMAAARERYRSLDLRAVPAL